jgi:SagB-type dehydrogenase family enzyme
LIGLTPALYHEEVLTMHLSTGKSDMSRRRFLSFSALLGGVMIGGRFPWAQRRSYTSAGASRLWRQEENLIPLPEPALDGEMALEQALSLRRSVRDFTGEALTMEQLSQLLWAAQGVTDEGGHRTAPSAWASYPLDIYVIENDKKYHYLPREHALELQLTAEHLQRDLANAAQGQTYVAAAPVAFVIACDKLRVSVREDFGIQEIGHAAQNLLLQAVALGLGAVPVGSMDRAMVQQVLQLPERHMPYTVIPVGHPAA